MDNLELLSQQLGFGVVTSEKLLDAVNQELPAYDGWSCRSSFRRMCVYFLLLIPMWGL